MAINCSHTVAGPADVLEVRTVNDQHECYVHYHGYNRRLDEWVGLGRVYEATQQAQTAPSAGTERTLTRNMKRKHNEINHVQKTFDEMDPTTAALEKEHETMTKVKYINSVQVCLALAAHRRTIAGVR
jgi:histone acetyltransferase MYST1